jgi:citrate synthase
MSSKYISPISMEAISKLCGELEKNNSIRPSDFERYHVKRGLRNEDGTGVMAGLTRICSVEGYYILDGEKVAKEGKLSYRGYDINDIVENCVAENRFGFEEVVWLLLFGELPTPAQLTSLYEVIDVCRFLPDDFIEDMMIKNPSKDIMNKLARCILGLYSYDENPDDISVQNVLRQSMQLIAQFPTILTVAYQVKRRAFYGKTMFLHPIKRGLSTAQYILRQTRADKKYTDEEAKLLDIILMLHADHGGGNNSTFATRVLTSSGTDTYSAIAAGIGSLKGPRHGGANVKTTNMMYEIMANVPDSTDESQVKDYLAKILRKEAGDGLGLIYGMGHAVYTISDPRAVILKNSARELAYQAGYEKEFKTLENVEKVTPDLLHEIKGDDKEICANVDLYSGLCYKVLGIPEDLFTPLFAGSRVVGWCAHRLEELTSSKRIIRPAYKSVSQRREYTPLNKRK